MDSKFVFIPLDKARQMGILYYNPPCPPDVDQDSWYVHRLHQQGLSRLSSRQRGGATYEIGDMKKFMVTRLRHDI